MRAAATSEYRLVICAHQSPTRPDAMPRAVIGAEITGPHSLRRIAAQLQSELGRMNAAFVETVGGDVCFLAPNGDGIRANDGRTDSVRFTTDARDLTVGTELPFARGRIRRVVLVGSALRPLHDAILMTCGRYTDLRTRFVLARQSARLRHELLQRPVFPLGTDSNGTFWYGDKIQVLHLPAADAPGDNLGINGEFAYAFVAAQGRGPDAEATASQWVTVTARDMHALPIRIGTRRSPLVPEGHVITGMYGVLDPLTQPEPSPMVTRPIGRTPLSPGLLHDLHARREPPLPILERAYGPKAR